jgi:hypothetical protein
MRVKDAYENSNAIPWVTATSRVFSGVPDDEIAAAHPEFAKMTEKLLLA